MSLFIFFSVSQGEFFRDNRLCSGHNPRARIYFGSGTFRRYSKPLQFVYLLDHGLIGVDKFFLGLKICFRGPAQALPYLYLRVHPSFELGHEFRSSHVHLFDILLFVMLLPHHHDEIKHNHKIHLPRNEHL